MPNPNNTQATLGTSADAPSGLGSVHRVTYIYADGHRETTDHSWPGRTAAELRRHWVERAKNAGWDFTWDGDVMVTARDDGFQIVIERREFLEAS